MIITKRIKQLHQLVFDFSHDTNALEVAFEENKKLAEWTVKYNIVKLQFVLTKKETVLCPVSTLFCRIYLGKNELFFYHIPEIAEYLEPDNYKCYYFPYIESEERLDACFSVLAAFLKKHYGKINEMAKSAEMSSKIKEEKQKEVIRLFTQKEPEKELPEVILYGYETYVLLPRYAADSTYREFLCGEYEKALQLYDKMEAKGRLTNYEMRLYAFIKELKTSYEALPDECNTLLDSREVTSPSAEGKRILRAAIVCELVLGMLFSAIVAVVNAILSSGTVYYLGMPWYVGFLFAGVPAVFGGIVLRNGIGKQTSTFDKLINPAWAEPFARIVFVVALGGMLFLCFCLSFASTAFYKEHMTYNEGEALLPTEITTCYYAELKQVYYSEGVYNDYGDSINRPAYLFEFEDGTVWNSDGFTSVKEVEEHIHSIVDLYYKQIVRIKARNALIE